MPLLGSGCQEVTSAGNRHARLAAMWRRLAGPLPGHGEARAMASVALVIGVVACGLSVVLGFHGKTLMGRPLGGDFVEFYTIGNILNHYPAARIYDLALAVRMQHQAVPEMPDTQMLMFGHAPYIASLFRPFALLPYASAYLAWLVFSAGLYAAALSILFRTLGLNSEDSKTGYLLALSCTPFLFETWIGGQVSVLAFFVWALFFWCLETHRRFLAGTVLALALFKPTIVAVPALMLLCGRRWRVLGGLIAGGAAMAALSLASVGVDGCRAWLATLAMNGRFVAGYREAWHLAKYVDLLAFFHLVLPSMAKLSGAVCLALGIGLLSWLGFVWTRSGNSLDLHLWAATLCFTLVVNVYAPIYDAVLLVPAIALAKSANLPIRAWLTALYLVPWLTQSFAEFLHVQLLTLCIVMFGIWIMRRSRLPIANSR